MSRVFEALKRAAEEKKETIPNSQIQTESVEQSVIEDRERPDSPADSTPTPRVLPTPGRWSKSWRGRAEELLFGWDLRRFKTHPIVVLEHDSPAAEQYKILREQVKKLRSEKGVCCLSVTSPVKQDGKTSVAVNLAAALALDTEEQVLLIDGDLRSPETHYYFGSQSTPGLTDYLMSRTNTEVTRYVKETFLPNLRILPAGKLSDRPSELLANDKMKTLMGEIRTRFPRHEIIVDTPPVLSTPDPLVLARQVDGIIMVMRAGKTPREYLLKAIESLNSSKVMGVVLNGVEIGLVSKYDYRKVA